MHSSRMRTGRSLTVCCSLLPGGEGGMPGPGGFSLPGGGLPGWGVCLVCGGLPGPGGCLPGPGGVLPARGVSAWSQGGLPAGGVCLVRGALPGLGQFSLPGVVVSAWSQGGLRRHPPPCEQNHRHV